MTENTKNPEIETTEEVVIEEKVSLPKRVSAWVKGNPKKIVAGAAGLVGSAVLAAAALGAHHRASAVEEEDFDFEDASDAAEVSVETEETEI